MEKAMLNGSVENHAKLMSVENLKDIIKNIAKCHSQEIGQETDTIKKREFDVNNIVSKVTLLKVFNGLDQEIIDEEVKALVDSVKNVMDSSILVKDQGIRELVPLSYEVLSLIFNSTNENFRQQFYQELVDYYYDELCKHIKKSSPIVFSREDLNEQVKVLSPIIKCDLAFKLANNKDFESQILLEEITSNITSYFKYSRLNQEDIYAVVNNKLGSNNYKLLSYELTPLDTRNGHLGDYFKLKIHVEFENCEQDFELFAKFLTPKLEVMKNLVRSGPSKKEEFFYMTYLPLLEKHGLQSLLDFAPKCYLSKINDVLVLDDMVSLDFTALTPNIKIGFDGLMFVVKQIAKLHSCSMILEESLSEEKGRKITLDEIYGEYFEEVIFRTDDAFSKNNMDGCLKLIHYLLKKFPELYKKLTYDELIEKIDVGWNSAPKKIHKSEKLKNAMCHGDMYGGNMLFKFDANAACVGAVLVDFQILRYCPPVHDLLFFIHQNSVKETRDKHYKDLTDGYYLELSRHLQNFNLDIANIYPKEEYEESLKYMKSQGVLQALYYSPFNTLDPELRESIMQDEKVAEKYFGGDGTALIDFGLENDAYRKVMTGLIADLVELCENGPL